MYNTKRAVTTHVCIKILMRSRNLILDLKSYGYRIAGSRLWLFLNSAFCECDKFEKFRTQFSLFNVVIRITVETFFLQT